MDLADGALVLQAKHPGVEMANLAVQTTFYAEDYLAWEERQAEKHEYIAGGHRSAPAGNAPVRSGALRKRPASRVQPEWFDHDTERRLRPSSIGTEYLHLAVLAHDPCLDRARVEIQQGFLGQLIGGIGWRCHLNAQLRSSGIG